MSASFLNIIGPQLKVWISFAVIYLCCFTQQSSCFCLSSVSMRLRPKRTCSGFECFGCFHIQSFSKILKFCVQNRNHNHNRVFLIRSG
ncbi:hypothetical protein HanPI659440_Chr16g0657631 [Helianthus annuus]|nr:hypothetical protein HanPI659440_Chr16g0657631 [Helianthus annuus]